MTKQTKVTGSLQNSSFSHSSLSEFQHLCQGFFVGQVQTCREQPHLAAQDAAYSEAVSGWLARGTAAKGTQSADCQMKHLLSVWRKGF